MTTHSSIFPGESHRQEPGRPWTIWSQSQTRQKRLSMHAFHFILKPESHTSGNSPQLCSSLLNVFHLSLIEDNYYGELHG